MTTRRTHTCNLCHGNVASDGGGVGLHWGLNNTIKFTTPGQAETHICQPCIGALETTLQEMRRIDAARALDEQTEFEASHTSGNCEGVKDVS